MLGDASVSRGAASDQQEVTVRGSHFIQEDSPAELGQAISDFLARPP
jgi:hypothetical protein